MKRVASAMLWATLFVPSVWAELIYVNPANQVTLSGSLNVDIDISGLGAPPYLGAFDINVTFDPTILNLSQIIFGTELGSPDFLRYTNIGGVLMPGVPGAGEAITGASLNGPTTDIFEVSLLPLLNTQTGSFTLFTMRFQGEGLGTSPIALTINGLSDENGNPLPIVTTADGSATVVPEPSAMILLFTCMLGVAMLGHKRWQRDSSRTNPLRGNDVNRASP